MYYDIELVANPEVLETMSELSVCSICTGLVIDPKQCSSCENAFCKICVEGWLKKNNSCPFKCDNPSFKDAGRALKTMINKLMLKCPKGCAKTFSYDSLKSHVCEVEIKIIPCPCCGTQVPSTQININQNKDLDSKLQALEKENKNLWQENVKLKLQLDDIIKGKPLNVSLFNLEEIKKNLPPEEEKKKGRDSYPELKSII